MKDFYDICKNESVLDNKNINDQFSVDLGDYKIYDQKGSMTCWIFASMNLIKKEIATKLNVHENNLDFSVSYLSFYDRYEKLDKLYDEIINKNCEINHVKYLLFDYINPFGSFSSFQYLVNKYGIVLDEQMPSNANILIPNDVNMVIKEKVIYDIDILLSAKSTKTKAELNEMKEQFLQEDFNLLVNIFGRPPEPTDLVLNSFVKDTLNQYIHVVSLNALEFNQKYNLNFNVPNFEPTQYLNVEITKIKNAVIKSLKEKNPVWFGCSYRYMSSSLKNKDGILDSYLYDFDKIGVKRLPKNIAEKYDLLNYDHAMVFTGVDLVDDQASKWKVLNTFGKDHNRNGYFIMNNNFFDDNVFLFAIKKKYLED